MRTLLSRIRWHQFMAQNGGGGVGWVVAGGRIYVLLDIGAVSLCRCVHIRPKWLVASRIAESRSYFRNWRVHFEWPAPVKTDTKKKKNKRKKNLPINYALHLCDWCQQTNQLRSWVIFFTVFCGRSECCGEFGHWRIRAPDSRKWGDLLLQLLLACQL